MTLSPSERDAYVDQIRESRGEPTSPARQFEIRAEALRLARSRLSLTGAAARSSLEREREFLQASIALREGRDIGDGPLSRTEERAVALSRDRDATPASGGVAPNVMYGDFARFGEPAEILSAREGHFMETVKRGAFATQFRSPKMPEFWFQHGKDPYVGAKPIGRITKLEERESGAHFEAALLDVGYVRDIAATAAAGLLGASFQFQTLRDRWRKPTRATEANPERIPERELLGVRVLELGPCAMPAYSGTSVGVFFSKRAAVRGALVGLSSAQADRAEVVARIKCDRRRQIVERIQRTRHRIT